MGKLTTSLAVLCCGLSMGHASDIRYKVRSEPEDVFMRIQNRSTFLPSLMQAYKNVKSTSMCPKEAEDLLKKYGLYWVYSYRDNKKMGLSQNTLTLGEINRRGLIKIKDVNKWGDHRADTICRLGEALARLKGLPRSR